MLMCFLTVTVLSYESSAPRAWDSRYLYWVFWEKSAKGFFSKWRACERFGVLRSRLDWGGVRVDETSWMGSLTVKPNPYLPGFSIGTVDPIPSIKPTTLLFSQSRTGFTGRQPVPPCTAFLSLWFSIRLSKNKLFSFLTTTQGWTFLAGGRYGRQVVCAHVQKPVLLLGRILLSYDSLCMCKETNLTS